MLVASCNKKVICFLSCTFNIFKCVVPDVQRGDKSMREDDMSMGIMVSLHEPTRCHQNLHPAIKMNNKNHD